VLAEGNDRCLPSELSNARSSDSSAHRAQRCACATWDQTPKPRRLRQLSGSLCCVYIRVLNPTSLPYFDKPICIEAPYLEGVSMLDLLMLVIGLAFFVVTIGYAVACDRL
jgi:hypothetical protein